MAKQKKEKKAKTKVEAAKELTPDVKSCINENHSKTDKCK